MRKTFYAIIAVVAVFFITACNDNTATNNNATDNDTTKNSEKVGVLIISHGSHSKQWRETLMNVGETVKPEIVKSGEITDVRSAFMEYNEPSIATRLKEFDEEGYSKVIIVPLFLTVSSHTADDIQNIAGIQKNPEVLATLKEEKIEVYNPKAKVVITPLLDFPGYLKKNVARRYNEVSKNPGKEGVVLVAYGSEPYEQQWKELILDIGKYLKLNAGVENISYAWCGHIVRYAPEPTTKAINQILELEEHAVVMPILVAVDENFQGKIILNGVEAVENHEEKVTYRQDAILPDENINQWIIDIVEQTVTAD